MLVVETIARIRREFFVKGRSIKEIVRDLKVSRNTVRKVLRSGETAFSYEREVQPLPKLGRWRDDLDRMLAGNEAKAARERLTLIRIFEELRGLGYEGGYDAVRRYARTWQRSRQAASADAYVPLSFAPGEAYQFDWSHEIVLLNGTTVTVKVAHVRLCHSRMLFVRAYPRETQEMVFDAHDRAFAFFKGACRRGLYDNMKTAVETVFIGKDRLYNRRFLQMCGHYLVEPTACTPSAGWEKGQVENQVGLVRERFFTPRLRFKSYEELNAWLLDRCVAYAKAHKHPEFTGQTVWSSFEAERPKPGALCRTLRRLPRPAGFRLQNLPGPLRQQQILGRGERGRPPGRDPGLCRPRGHSPGRHRRRRAPALLRARRDDLRSLALRAGAGEEARGAEERRAVQGLGAAGRHGAGAPQARCRRRWRPSDGDDPHRRAERRAWPRRGRLRRGVARRRPLRRRHPQHPCPPPRPGGADHDHHPACAESCEHEPAADCARYDTLRRAS